MGKIENANLHESDQATFEGTLKFSAITKPRANPQGGMQYVVNLEDPKLITSNNEAGFNAWMESQLKENPKNPGHKSLYINSSGAGSAPRIFDTKHKKSKNADEILSAELGEQTIRIAVNIYKSKNNQANLGMGIRGIQIEDVANPKYYGGSIDGFNQVADDAPSMDDVPNVNQSAPVQNDAPQQNAPAQPSQGKANDNPFETPNNDSNENPFGTGN